jgi:hypothetical protein
VWIKEHLIESESLIVALTSYNADSSKETILDFPSLLGNSDFSAILLKDLSNSWYTKGLEGVGNSHEDVIAYLTSIRARYKRVLFIGDSMGAFGAILLGSRLNADKIIAISPQTTVSPQTCRLMGDGRFLRYFDRLTDIPAAIQDAREILRVWPPKSLDIYVSRGDIADVENAMNIEGLPNVNIQYIEQFDHWMAEQLKRYSALRGMVRNFLLNRGTYDVARFLEEEKALYQQSLSSPSQGSLLPGSTIYLETVNITPNWTLRERLNHDQTRFRSDVFRSHQPSFVTRHYHFNDDILEINPDFFTLPIMLPTLTGEIGTNTVLTHPLFKGASVSNLGVPPIRSSIEVGTVSEDVVQLSDGDDLLPRMSFPGSTVAPQIDPNVRGHVMSGPYVTLESGNYLACVELGGAFEAKGTLVLDVACNSGRVIVSREYSACTIRGGHTLTVPFYLAKTREKIEIRLHSNEGASGSVAQVLLKKVRHPRLDSSARDRTSQQDRR